MAYFSNSGEGEVFDNECARCPLSDQSCPIALVQMVYNYDACNNDTASNILNVLVKQENDSVYVGCQMKPLIDKLAKG